MAHRLRIHRNGRRMWWLGGRNRVRPGIGEVKHDHISDDPLILQALIESEWQQTWSA